MSNLFTAQYAARHVHHGWQQRRSLQCHQEALLCQKSHPIPGL